MVARDPSPSLRQDDSQRLPTRFTQTSLYQALTGAPSLGPGGRRPGVYAAVQHAGIDAHAGLGVPGGCLEDAQVGRQVRLGQRRHHTARAGACHLEPHLLPDEQRLTTQRPPCRLRPHL